MKDPWAGLGIEWNTPLETVPTTLTGIEVRQIFVANLVRTRHLSAGDPALFAAFHASLGPGIRAFDLRVPFVPSKRQGISTCGLYCEHQLAISGADEPRFFENYYPIKSSKHYSITRSIDFGKRNGCWQDSSGHAEYDAWVRPYAGIAMVIGCRTPQEARGGSEHMLGVASVIAHEETHTEALCVEAGHVDLRTGLQRVRIRKRRFEVRDCRVWCFDAELDPCPGQGRLQHGRIVLGWIMPEAMPLRPTCLAPQRWQKILVI